MHKLINESTGWSVVTWVVNAKFFTSPQDSPSGVSEGHSIPHWDGWSDLGPEIFLVFSNWELTLVIIPNAEIKDSLESTWVIPALSILNLFRDQFPVEIAFSKAEVIVSARKQVCTSNGSFLFL
jgi:hypothetical protein